ncbi:MAG TPA: hypothetical protein IAC82_05845 [Candidatus Merdivicinus intestinigallinarum]|nr:hypothetical protein [Candidatus Merdivicinus intestinigallinarum]
MLENSAKSRRLFGKAGKITTNVQFSAELKKFERAHFSGCFAAFGNEKRKAINFSLF